MSILTVDQVSIGYSSKLIIENLSVEIPENQITSIIGPNGCGKSTLLNSIARVLKTKKGAVYLDGRMIHQFELVSYGRFPHQKGMGSLKKLDYDFINWAIEVTSLSDLKEHSVDALSGGQRQRVWIAMALAQDTEILILDEPTTYLDMAHQLEILLLLEKLNVSQKRTIVMVLHDLNHASRFSHNMVAMKDGELIVEGSPNKVMTHENLSFIFNIDAHLMNCPFSNHPICISYNLCNNSSVPENVHV